MGQQWPCPFPFCLPVSLMTFTPSLASPQICPSPSPLGALSLPGSHPPCSHYLTGLGRDGTEGSHTFPDLSAVSGCYS